MVKFRQKERREDFDRKRVKYIGGEFDYLKGLKGIVLGKTNSSGRLVACIQFDNPIVDGHDGASLFNHIGKKKHCWNVNAEDVEVLK